MTQFVEANNAFPRGPAVTGSFQALEMDNNLSGLKVIGQFFFFFKSFVEIVYIPYNSLI